MARLVVMQDPLRGVREHHRLTEGATLADELRRLYPQGFGARWALHKAEALSDGEIDPSVHERTLVESEAVYIVTVKPAGPVLPWLVNLVVSFAISYAIGAISQMFARKPPVVPNTEQENKQSPNNQVAGQSNRLRAGARVPDILGRVRAYPDLLSSPVERWFWPHTQSIVQFFVIGRGSYELLARRLGDTPFGSIEGVSWNDFPPGSTITALQAIQSAPTVDNILLDAQEAGVIVTGVTFDAETRTVTSPTRIDLSVGLTYFVTGTFNNTRDFFVSAVPPEDQTVGPYVYTLDGIVVDETANAVFNLNNERGFIMPPEWTTNPRGNTHEIWFHSYLEVEVGDLIVVSTGLFSGGPPFYFQGRVTAFERADFPPPGVTALPGATYVTVENMDHTLPVFSLYYYGDWSAAITYIPGGGVARRADDWTPTPFVESAEYTDWFVAPMDEPDEIWIDFEFPSGLAHYTSGVRSTFTVSFTVEFRSLATPATVVTKTYTYTSAQTSPLHSTEVVTLGELGLSGPIEVRMVRATPIQVDTATEQWVQDTRWRSLRSVKNIPPHSYDDVTVTQLIVFNSASASSVGERSFNVIATRILPTWAAGVWSAPAPTEKWADNLIARMKASDGAHKPDAEIDLAGIYAVQAALDAMDGGDQGKISMTLDELQDIDAELQTIASVVRCQVYRIGRKIYVTRDEGGKVPLALFTGRSKSPDGEQVQMAMQNDAENDAVVVTWFDRANGWKQREYQYPEGVTPVNALRIAPAQATWAQAFRRALYEWNRAQYRRDSLSMEATEEARLIHIGDVVNVTDDIANLAQSAGEIFKVAGLTLTLDREVDLAAGGFTIMLRGQDGRTVDAMPVTQGATLREVVLAHAPAFAIKGRDEGLGSVFAIYQSANAVVRPWLVTNIEPSANYTRVLGMNWRTEVFAGDTATLPAAPDFSTRGGLPNDAAA